MNSINTNKQLSRANFARSTLSSTVCTFKRSIYDYTWASVA
jgi:hypothetical protein